MSDLLDTKSAARYLTLAVQTLVGWRQAGMGPPYIRMGRAIRYRESDLDFWINRHIERPKHDVPPEDPDVARRQRAAKN